MFLRNLKFIKIGVFENIFLKRVCEKRADEVAYLTKGYFYQGIMMFTFIFGNGIIIVVFLYLYYWAGYSMNVGLITVFVRVLYLLQHSIQGIPSSLTGISDIFVSMRRLTLFLESKELEFAKVKQEPNPDSRYAVEIKDGSFYWDKRISRDELKAKEEAKNKSKRKRGKGKKAKEEVTTSSALRKTLLSTATDETGAGVDGEEDGLANKEDRRFTMENLNFKAERGKLTVVIGKIGSGKSSILYSLLGEMRVGDFENTKVFVNGSVCYLGQNPWIFNGTIKENILLDKEFDQEAFNFAIKYSALEDDIKAWEDGVEKKVGESGASISGGQKARVALARCLYQR